MQSFLAASSGYDGHSPAAAGGGSAKHAFHGGAHHPLAGNGNDADRHPPHVGRIHATGRAQSLSSIKKLLLFAATSLAVLLLVFFGPSWSTHPTHRSASSQSAPITTVERSTAPSSSRASPQLKRVDGHSPPSSAPSASDYAKRFFAVAPPTVCPSVVWDRAEISRHKSLDDLWIVINGAVLNVTRFVPGHPGGRVIVDGSAEDDAASLFAQYHSPSTLSLLSNFCIGRLPTSAV